MYLAHHEDIASDRVAGYKLGINLGQVTNIVSEEEVVLWWQFADGIRWSGQWIPWRYPRTHKLKNQCYTTRVHSRDLLSDAYGNIAKIKTEKTGHGDWYKIAEESYLGPVREIVEAWLETCDEVSEWEHGSDKKSSANSIRWSKTAAQAREAARNLKVPPTQSKIEAAKRRAAENPRPQKKRKKKQK